MGGRKEFSIMTNDLINSGEYAGNHVKNVPREYLEFLLTTGLLDCLQADIVQEELRARDEI